MTGCARIQLTPEESVLFLTCRPYLSPSEDEDLLRLATSQISWEYVVWRAEFFCTLPLVLYHMRRLDAVSVLPDDVHVYLKTWTELSTVRSHLLMAELDAITLAFDAAGLDYFLLKGSALAPMYPDPTIRPMLDVDIMIRGEQSVAARETMLRMGYAHALWNPDTDNLTVLAPHQIAESREDHYELPVFLKRVRTPVNVPASVVPRSWRRKHLKCFISQNQIGSFPIFVDLHLNLSLDFDLADVWSGVEREILFGRPISVQSSTGMIWFLAARIYHEAFQLNTVKLSMFGDAHTVLHCRSDNIDWDQLVAITKKYGMQPSLYYVLGQLKKLSSSPVPDKVLSQLEPDRFGIPHAHDWGDLIPKLFSRAILHDISLS